ncbi:hypothetical protein DAPPUDRAFT_114527 [Daphnia pulex]|uniref:JmjC domain-containing protein n=1 Tax=Daphnia pulex TaxID=6669 RepID=E9HIF5_DAPPU|nr:hypothetical protein DAPPUDRAFT_114527 [Daphnia pulex]|eukprot:EFX68494.1 hypothetical protein DAPPUDRAFT_114527 [Daphnia pulex]
MGRDLIHNQMIANLTDTNKTHLLHLFNRMLTTHFVPPDWKTATLKSKNLSEEESLALLEISDHSGLTLPIDIEKENFYDVVHDVYTKYGKKHGAVIVRPLKANYIADTTTLSHKHVIPYTEVLTNKSAGCFTMYQQAEKITKKKKEGHTTYNAFRKQAIEADFQRSPGYDLGGRSSFWPLMIPFLSKIAENGDFPRYVNNKGYSFFPKDNVSEWCLHLSNSYSKYLLEPEKKLNMDGIDSVELFIGEAGSMTANKLVRPKCLNRSSKVSYKHRKKVTALAEKKYPELYKDFPAADLHKNMVMLPQELLLANIPFRTPKQLPGDYVITLPEGLHFVINSGHSIAEATNYACDDWVKHRKTFPNCTCKQSKKLKDDCRTI